MQDRLAGEWLTSTFSAGSESRSQSGFSRDSSEAGTDATNPKGGADRGFADLRAGRLADDDLAVHAAATAIFIAADVNTFVKAAIAVGMGGKAMGLRVGFVYAVVLTAGIAALWFAIGEG